MKVVVAGATGALGVPVARGLRSAGEDWDWAAALFFGTGIAAVATPP